MTSALRAAFVLTAIAVATAQAQDSCAGNSAPITGSETWSAPLNRTVGVRLRDVTLRSALDRLATAARIRISYSAELLPANQRLCIPADSISLGDALQALLRGTSLEPVIVAADLVVLAPVRAAPDGTRAAAVSQSVGVLDRVVVTGNVIASTERPLTVGLDVMDGAALERSGATTMAQMLDAFVPGLWLWEQSPTSLLANYGSIRGASSFGVSYPKIYIDGIEVANPLLVAQFSPDLIERIEVIRGPQGAALYGSDAISGVINIITSHASADASGRRTSFQSGVGLSQSAFASRAPLVQQHALTLRGGSPLRSGDFSVRVAALGDFMPGANARQLSARGGLRVIGERTTFTGSARLFAEEAGVARSPLLPPAPSRSVASFERRMSVDSFPHRLSDSLAGEPVDSTTPQAVRQYTLGATTTFVQNGLWTHSFVVGIDGYRLSNVVSDGGPIPSPTDSALQAARGGGDRGTLRVSSVARFGSNDGKGTSSTLTLSVEHAALREESAWSLDSHERPGAPPVVQRPWVRWQSNTGILGQLNTSVGNDFFLTGGVRFERNDALLGDDGQVATLPMLGAAYVHDVGALSVKLRSAYGKGIRAPRTPSRSLAQFGSSYAALAQSLAPERQSGIEGGVDVFYNRRVSLHLTRFDQTASGLIQQVVIYDTTMAPSYFGRRITYELQNVGKITNRGWEMQGTTAFGPMVLAGSLSLVDSRVAQLATGYTGDLRPGDRMLGVPSRTASATATWTHPLWSASLGATRAWDWVNYDRITLGEAVAIGVHSMHDFVGTRLRSYWLNYDGATRLRATGFREITRGFGVTLTGDNLLNRQTGEPDNATIVPGRTITVGVRAKF